MTLEPVGYALLIPMESAIESQKSNATRPTSGRPVFPARTTAGHGITLLITNKWGCVIPGIVHLLGAASHRVAADAEAPGIVQVYLDPDRAQFFVD